jgi:hypothetical protein
MTERGERFARRSARGVVSPTDVCPHCNEQVQHYLCCRQAPQFSQQQMFMVLVETASDYRSGERNFLLKIRPDRRFTQRYDDPARRWRMFGPGTSVQLGAAFRAATGNSNPVQTLHANPERHDCRVADIAPCSSWWFEEASGTRFHVQSSFEDDDPDPERAHFFALCDREHSDGWRYPTACRLCDQHIPVQ